MTSAAAQPLVLREPELLPDNSFQVVLELESAALDIYLVLWRGDTPNRIMTPVRLGLGRARTVLQDAGAGLADSRFYRVEAVPVGMARDLDGDGLSDFFELTYAAAFDPLNPADAAGDFDGDGFDNLEEQARGTDPTDPTDRPVVRVATTPLSGETGVSVNREVTVIFEKPVASETHLHVEQFFLEFGSRRILARTGLSSDRTRARLFPLEPLPAGSRIQAVFDAAGVHDVLGREVDADGDGLPGGRLRFDFTTFGATPIQGTAVVGRVFDSEMLPDGAGGFTNRPLAGVIITVDGAEESLRATTDSTGFFHLEPAPAGRFFVHIDGRNAFGSTWPGGSYYPFIGKAWEALPGRTNNLAGGTGEIFLPRIVAGTLQPVSATADTEIPFPQEVIAAQPDLEGVRILVPANALFAADGTRGGRAGIAPVPPDRLPEPLPAGLALPLVITIQTDGPMNFDTPVPVRFPNLPDPLTGEVLPPGGRSLLWSYRHDTGRWEVQGTMTVSADGSFVETDPGVGVRQPGWHGSMPGSFSDEGGGGECVAGAANRPGLARSEPVGLSGGGCASCIFSFNQAAMDMTFCVVNLALAPLNAAPAAGCAITTALNSLQATMTCLIAVDAERAGVTPPTTCDGAFLEEAASGTFFSCIPGVGAAVGIFLGCRTGVNSVNGLIDCLARALSTSESGISNWTVRQPAASPLWTGNFLQDQIDLATLAESYLLAWLGDPAWLAGDSADRTRLRQIWEAVVAANAVGSPGGPRLHAVEADFIRQQPRPGGVSETQMNILLARLDRFFAKDIPDPDWEAIRTSASGLHNKLLELQSRGWTTTTDGFTAKPAEFSRQISNEIPRQNLHPKTRYLLINARTGFEIRGETTELGEIAGPEFRVDPVTGRRLPPRLPAASPTRHLQSTPGGAEPPPPRPPEREGPILAPNTLHVAYFLDPSTLRVGGVIFRSAPNGQTTHIPRALLTDLELPDTDNDGLSDLAERIVGTDPNNPDTDGDGLPDAVEVRAGGAPLGDDPLPLGIVAAVDTDGEAVDLAAHERYTVLADSANGLVVVEVDGLTLTRTAVVPAPGLTRAVAVDGHWAVGGGTRGVLTVLNLDRPAVGLATPHTRIRLGAPIAGVAVADPLAFVALENGQLLAVHLEAGLVLDRLAVSRQKLDDVVVAGNRVAVLAGARLHLLERDGVWLRRLGDVPNAGYNPSSFFIGRSRLFTDGTRTLATHPLGFNTFDLTGSGPVLVRTTPTGQRDWKHLIAIDNTRGMAAMGLNSGLQPADDNVSLHDLEAPAGSDGFLALFRTPGSARAVLSRQGFVQIADHRAGLQVLNLLPPDRAGIPPTVSIRLASGEWAVQEAVWIEVVADAMDDIGLRQVEFLVNGRVVYTDFSFPFRHRLRAPAAGAPFVLAARALDTAGNATLSEPLPIAVLPDATAPQLLQTAPAFGAAVGALHEIVALFSERLHPATVAGDSVVLRAAGPDDLFDTADDTTPAGAPQTLRLINETLVISLAAPPPPGRYRIEISPALTDLAGLSVTNLFAPIFRVAGPADMTDTDRDGLPDVWEVTMSGTDPTRDDTDGNGIPDGDEDPDGDGLNTLFELTAGTDPKRVDTFQTGRSDADLDADGDGLTLWQEMVFGTDPTRADTDGDGWNDEAEITLGSRPNDPRSRPRIFSLAPTRPAFARPAWEAGAGLFAAPRSVDLARPALERGQGTDYGTTAGQPLLILQRNAP